MSKRVCVSTRVCVCLGPSPAKPSTSTCSFADWEGSPVGSLPCSGLRDGHGSAEREAACSVAPGGRRVALKPEGACPHPGLVPQVCQPRCCQPRPRRPRSLLPHRPGPSLVAPAHPAPQARQAELCGLPAASDFPQEDRPLLAGPTTGPAGQSLRKSATGVRGRCPRERLDLLGQLGGLSGR